MIMPEPVRYDLSEPERKLRDRRLFISSAVKALMVGDMEWVKIRIAALDPQERADYAAYAAYVGAILTGLFKDEK
jgi:hypothetical protein